MKNSNRKIFLQDIFYFFLQLQFFSAGFLFVFWVFFNALCIWRRPKSGGRNTLPTTGNRITYVTLQNVGTEA